MAVSDTDELPEELLAAIRDIYTPSQLAVTTQPCREADPKGHVYQSCRFGLNGRSVAFRVAKTTLDRPGHFVTLWKRSSESTVIVPFDSSDSTDFVVVCVESHRKCGKSYRGQFVFSKKILTEKGIMSCNSKPGKLAFRVFPPWSEDLAIESILELQKKSAPIKKTQYLSKSAIKSQNWQLDCFFPIAADGSANVAQVRKLFDISELSFGKTEIANETPEIKS